jgi:hypothetical protein
MFDCISICICLSFYVSLSVCISSLSFEVFEPFEACEIILLSVYLFIPLILVRRLMRSLFSCLTPLILVTRLMRELFIRHRFLRRHVRSLCFLCVSVYSLLIFCSLYFCSMLFNCPKHVADILEMLPYFESRASMMLVSQIRLVISDESWKNARYGSWPTKANPAIFRPGHLVLNKESECNRGEQLNSCRSVSLENEIFEQHKIWSKGFVIIISPWNHFFNVYYKYFWPPLWSSDQSSWLQIQRYEFDFRRYQIFWEVVCPERGLPKLVSIIKKLLEEVATTV